MKVLVLGSKGQRGRCLYDQFIRTDYQVIYETRADFNITDLSSSSEHMALIEPEIVINASAYKAVNKVEDNKKIRYEQLCVLITCMVVRL